MRLNELLDTYTMTSDPRLVIQSRDGRIRCLACGHRCTILPNRRGVCRVRFNAGGALRVPAGYVAGVQVDPIEKKPFYHAFPGQSALSFGMLGCDLHCPYCQNWVTTQALRDERMIPGLHFTTPQHLVELAIHNKTPVIVSTYNEPLISVDWSVEIFKCAKQAGLVCGFVSNGNATPQALEFIRPYVDLYKVDLKTFRQSSYRKLGGDLTNVLDTIRRLQRMDFWVEIVTLVVPGFNDSDAELHDIAAFIADVSCDIPWHVTAFRPDYKMSDRSATSRAALLKAHEIGRNAGLHFVYAGNVPNSDGAHESTYCPTCSSLLIQRRGMWVQAIRMAGSRCLSCDSVVPGRFERNAYSASSGAPRSLPVSTLGRPCG